MIETIYGKRIFVILSSVIIISLLFVYSSAGKNTGKKSSKKVRYFTLNFKNVEMSEFLNAMSRIIKKNIIFGEIKGRITIISARRVPVERALDVLKSILEYKELAVIEGDNILKIVPIENAKKRNVEVIIEVIRIKSTSDD